MLNYVAKDQSTLAQHPRHALGIQEQCCWQRPPCVS